MNKKPLQLVILISGHGGNLQAIIDAINAGQLKAEITCVISNKEDAYGLQRAHKAHLTTKVLSHRDYPDRETYDKQLATLIDSFNPDVIVLAGFMRILSEHMVDPFAGKVINIHPSLLPKYPGLNTHEKALANGDKEHGCSIHYVTKELDGGPIIAQAKLRIHPDDTADSLKSRVQALEHQLYPEVLRKLAEQKK